MDKKNALFVLTFIFCSCISPKDKIKSELPPNIVFILADDLGWSDLPNYGNKFNEAPNIERLAREGMQFNNAYAMNPVCSPTRASIQTGQYPARIGINDFLLGHWRPFEKLTVPSNKTQYLPLSYETIGESMQKAGYQTGYFGKWHLGNTEKYYPKNQGYNESVVYNGGGFFNYNNLMFPKTNFSKSKVLSEALTDLSIEFIKKNKNNPFFLFLSHYDVHVQLDAQEELIDKYLKKTKIDGYPCNAVYASMIENIDKSVGKIMDELKALNISNNTIIVFFSDNGGLVNRFDKKQLLAKEKLNCYKGDTLQYVATSNKPLRGEKGTVYEGGIREPFIVKWPNKIKQGYKSNALVGSIDLFPTFLEMAEGKLPENQIIDGKSIIPEMMEEKLDSEREFFWHYPVYHHSVPASAVRKGDFKLIHFYDDNHLELYNLKDDISESNNLAQRNKEKTTELFGHLKNWLKVVDAAMPVENPNFNQEKRNKWAQHPDFNNMLSENN